MARWRPRDRGRVRRRARRLRGNRGPRALGPLPRSRLHRRPHAPRVVEAARGRVCAPRPPPRDDCGRRGSARDRQRSRDRRCPLACGPVPRPPAGRVLHGLVLCPGIRVRVPAAAAPAGRPGGPAAAQARDRSRGDDELPRRRLGLGVRAREARSSRRHARRRPRSVRPRQGAERVRGGGYPLRPRGQHDRRGPRAATCRHVGADPRGVRRPEPPRAAPARPRVRPSPSRFLHRRPGARAHR